MVLDDKLFTLSENTQNVNKVKDLVLARLAKDGVISKEIALHYTHNWQVIIVKSNWFQSWCSKFNITKDSWQYLFVKFMDQDVDS